MRPIQWFFLIVISLGAVVSMADPAPPSLEAQGGLDEAPSPPSAAIKVRGLPLLSGLASSLNAGRFNHSIMVDAEAFVAPGYSVGLAVGHSRLTIGGDSQLDDVPSGRDRYDHFIEETQLGFLLTRYFNPALGPTSFYLRAHGFAVFPSTDAPAPGGGLIPVNQSRDSFGFRTGLELGWVFRKDAVVFDLGAGFSAHLKNPYTPFQGDNKHGVPASVSNAFFGISDVYPTVNLSLGIVL